MATDWNAGDILLWPDHGGIAEHFLSCDGRLFVNCEKLDVAPWPKFCSKSFLEGFSVYHASI